jgi:hypothetical protein
MSKLKLFTAFHLNLAFSSIPQDQYALAIDNCYWPMVNILDKFENIKFGLEFTGYTLEKIKEVDYTFVNKIKELHSKGKCEFIGSGMSQAIFPLIPMEANVKNLGIGNKIYKEILGVVPESAYVNEQTYSDGIAEIYHMNDYNNLIMEFNNADLFNKYPKEYRYQSHKIKVGDGELNLVWNNSIAFQKLQRYAFGSITLEEYLDYLHKQYDVDRERILCLYGSDLEIFDYKPGNHDWKYNPKATVEMERLYKLFEILNSSEEFEFILPRDAARNYNSDIMVNISTAQYPVVCKKQPKYNVVRWAVSGLQNTKMNSECNRIYNDLNILKKINSDSDELWKDLSLLYGSDYRTKTTESKFNEYYQLSGKIKSDIDNKMKQIYICEDNEFDFYLLNTNYEKTSENFIYEGEISFEKGKIFEKNCSLILNSKEVDFQLENIKNYRDGSVRECNLLFNVPSISSKEKIYGKFITKELQETVNNKWVINEDIIETNKVKIEFSRIKKGVIKNLVLKDVSNRAVLGEINHGYYDDIRYSSDYFSGHTILREDSLNQITDLDGSTIIYPKVNEKYNIRIPVKSKINGKFGELWKIYYIYMNESRIDIEYNFRFKDVHPVFLRTGILTIKPDFFDIDTLGYSTNNGGRIEKYNLRNKEFNQIEKVSLNISSNSCVGASEEVLSIYDNNKEVIIQRDNSLLYSVPMLDYREIDNEYFFRVYHSLSESDDTGRIYWRGHSKFRMSISNSKQKHFNHGVLMIKKDGGK